MKIKEMNVISVISPSLDYLVILHEVFGFFFHINIRAYERPRPTGQGHLTRASENLKNVLANLAVVFQNRQAQQNFHWPWPVGRGLS